jgi:flagellar motor switch protein FliN
MSDGSLSQEEIDALVGGTAPDDLTATERDALGEIGNICMSSSATALSSLLGHQVQITTPSVELVAEDLLRHDAARPAAVVVIEYTAGLDGRNVFILGTREAAVIADLMMGGDGTAPAAELSELHVSAVAEAMNQMMGSAATAMAELLAVRVDISAPSVDIVDLAVDGLPMGIDGDEPLVRVGFQLSVGDLVDTTLMQVMPVAFARALVGGLLEAQAAPAATPAPEREPDPLPATPAADDDRHLRPVPVPVAQPVAFPSLDELPSAPGGSDISLLLDVPLQVTVELGRTQMRIRNVLELVPGSIIELDKLAGEPVDVLVNGKQIARGEVVVIDEEFGVRITDVASQAKRLRGLAAEA